MERKPPGAPPPPPGGGTPESQGFKPDRFDPNTFFKFLAFWNLGVIGLVLVAFVVLLVLHFFGVITLSG
jgi:hypothetical protein